MDVKYRGQTIKVDGIPLFTINSDGTVTRYIGSQKATPSPDTFTDGAKSKDVTVNSDTAVYVRMYLPERQNGSKFPVLFYVHGGAFCVGSADSVTYHKFMNKLAKEIGAICVSVNYRRIPEHRLPAAFDDCFEALRWFLAGPGKIDPWITNHGDMNRVFLVGDSAGATIVHELGLRSCGVKWDDGVQISGAVLLHPFFHEKSTGRAESIAEHTDKVLLELMLPLDEDLDYPPFNPVGRRSPPLGGIVYERMLVAVAGKDPLKNGGVEYFEELVGVGKNVKLIVNEDEMHVFFLRNSDGTAASELIGEVRSFVQFLN